MTGGGGFVAAAAPVTRHTDRQTNIPTDRPTA